MSKKIISLGLLLLLSTFLVGLPWATNAQTPTSIIDPTAASYQSGDYTLPDILAIVIGASRWVLGLIGSLALIMFIYGGFTFLISAGSSEKIGEARKIIIAAVIGLIIVFTSYIIIRFVLTSLGLNWSGGKIITP